MTDSSVLIIYNEPHGDCSAGVARNVESDVGVLDEVAAVGKALTTLGITHRECPVRALNDVGRELSSCRESYVINLVESLHTSAADACMIPAVCAAFGKPWTGNGTACQLLALDKWLAKCALSAAGIPVPEAAVVLRGSRDMPSVASTGPVIIKPLRADASEGIDPESVLMKPNKTALLKRAARIHQEFHQPALVERYVDGREFNVSILERNGKESVLPLAEIDFSAFADGRPRIVDYRAKWIEDSFEFINTPRRLPADLDEATARKIRDAALAAWKCLGCRDYARVDMRIDAEGRPFVLDVNPNPDISPGDGFVAALQAAGIDFADFVGILLKNAGFGVDDVARPSSSETETSGLHIRWSRVSDRQAILGLIEGSGNFRPSEIDVAREVLDEALVNGAGGHYQSYTGMADGSVAGWICFGPTPCAAGTFDVYWLAVGPAFRCRGLGSALLAHAEALIQVREGRLIVVETSSRNDYAPARRFYERHGYRKASVVPDFYENGDDKLVYVKAVSKFEI